MTVRVPAGVGRHVRAATAIVFCGALAAVSALAVGSVANAQSRAGPDYVAIAKRTSMKALDSTLADVPFERWLTGLANGKSFAVTWEVNDCGEGGDGRAAPTCVEAQFKIRGDSVASISIAVTDLTGKRQPPHVWWTLIGAGTQFSTVKSLSEWVAAVTARRDARRLAATRRTRLRGNG